MSFNLTRTIYDPATKDFVFDSGEGQAMSNIKNWILNKNPVTYWYVLRVDNLSEEQFDQWGIELFMHQALSIKDAYIDGIDRRFELKRKDHDIWNDKHVFSIPWQFGIPLVGRGSRRIFFKVDINCREGLMHEYGISGNFIVRGMNPVGIKEKIFRYSCKVDEFKHIFEHNPDEASSYAEKKLSGRYVAADLGVLTNSFRLIYELLGYCYSSSVEKDELMDKLHILRESFARIPDIAGKRINPLLDNGIRELDILIDRDKFRSRYIRLCDSLVELIIIEVMGGGPPSPPIIHGDEPVPIDDFPDTDLNIKIIGCGGAGSNIVQSVSEKLPDYKNLESIAINTDAQHLLHVDAMKKILIGKKKCRGLGAGSLPIIGEKAALENADEISSTLMGADLVFITAGLGGGSGTGASPVVAEISRDQGALTLGLVSLPYGVEGKTRKINAEEGLEKLRGKTDTVMVYPNDRLLESCARIPLNASFRLVDDYMMKVIKGITDLTTTPCLVNISLADVRTVFQNGGIAMVGIGQAEGTARATEAVQNCLHSIFLNTNISRCSSLLVMVCGGSDLSLPEVGAVVQEVHNNTAGTVNVVRGAKVYNEFDGYIQVVIIAPGLDPSVVWDKNIPKYGVRTMELKYEDIFSYLLNVKKDMQKNNLNLKDLSNKSKRRELVSRGLLNTYGSILEMCGLSSHDTKAQFHTLPDILNEINEKTSPVLLSALVVNSSSYLPGNKYFEFWHQARKLSDDKKLEVWLQDIDALLSS